MAATTVTIDRSGCPRQPTQSGVPPKHGTRDAYRRGCRCADAREARRLYMKRRREGRLQSNRVPVLGSRRRLQSLMAQGHSLTSLSKIPGLPSRATLMLIHRGEESWVYRPTHDAIAAAFERLSMIVGPSTRARNIARAAGHHPPFAWTGINIDNPRAAPDPGDAPSRGVDVADLARSWRDGVTIDELARITGRSSETIHKLLQMQGCKVGETPARKARERARVRSRRTPAAA